MHTFTPRAVMDFETYSEAGYVWTPAKPSELVWNEKQQAYVTKDYLPTWSAPRGATKKGIFAVGAAAYTAHSTAEVLCLWYNLKDGYGPRFWAPGLPNPTPLFDWVHSGQVIEAHNAGFEFWVWLNICVLRYGWPAPRSEWFVCSMAKAQAWALPGGLDAISKILQLKTPKIDGKSLLSQLSCPRNPTKNNPKTRTRPEDVPVRAAALYAYCLRDIQAESEASERIPDLLPDEQAFWQATLKMNIRGVAVDMEAVRNASTILDQTLETYDSRLCALTGGAVEKSSQVKRLQDWLAALGVFMSSLDSDHIERALADDTLPPDARQALDYRAKAGSASVKKLYAIERMAVAGRLHDLFIYHRARTGRDGGADVQPQNLPKAGPKVSRCVQCGRWHGAHAAVCLRCGGPLGPAESWTYEAVPQALEDMTYRNAQWVEQIYGDALLTISGCIRGMFVAGPGMDLIASDYSSIEAVVTAVLAGEQWRIDAFNRREDIYYHGAAGVTGKTYEWYKQYEAEHGKHSDRQKIGKPAELGLGFGGWLHAWLQFDSSGTFSEDEIKANIQKWRDASPAIVEFWGGQTRGKPWAPDRHELYGLEGMAIAAIQNPGTCYNYRYITFGVKDDVLYARLPSGRYLAYHKPRLERSDKWEGQLSITFEGYNSNPQMGPIGWHRMKTYGGRLAENMVQAVARDYMRDAVLRLETAGYPIVLRVHDEIVAEVPEGWGSVEEFEAIMSQAPAWAQGWPIRAAGGYRAKRYRKD